MVAVVRLFQLLVEGVMNRGLKNDGRQAAGKS
jgi:hypothetical protein